MQNQAFYEDMTPDEAATFRRDNEALYQLARQSWEERGRPPAGVERMIQRAQRYEDLTVVARAHMRRTGREADYQRLRNDWENRGCPFPRNKAA